MTSAIDPTKPTSVNPKFSDVRANFTAAKEEIEALQVAIGALSAPDWADITGTPTTIAGYGITDAVSTDYVDDAIAAVLGTASSAYDTLGEIEAALEALTPIASKIRIALDAQSIGTVPALRGAIRLPAGTYSPAAYLGCPDITYAATVTLKDGATTKATIGAVAGGLAWRTAADFTLSVDTDIDIYLNSNNASALALVYGLEL